LSFSSCDHFDLIPRVETIVTLGTVALYCRCDNLTREKNMPAIHPSLLWFMWLGVIPVILHLLLKAKPKKLVFPALRLIQNRQRQNTQKMRLKHFWLMLLRVLAILILVLGLARPRIPAANYWPTLFEWSTLVVILAAAIGVWYMLTSRWKRQPLSAYHLQHRRTLLRAGLIFGVILAILLGVGWPLQRRVMAQIKDPGTPINENVPVASILMFDTSPSMQYRQASQTRLELALELAQKYQKRLPSGSKLAIADTASTNPITFLPDLTTAASRMVSLENKSLTYSFNERLRTALESHKEDRLRVMESESSVPEADRQDAFVREIIVFTDMSPAQWRQSQTNLLKADLARELGVNLYLIDVSVAQPINISLSDLKLLEPVLTSGGVLRVQATVTATGQESARVTVDLNLPGEGGQGPRKAASQTVDLSGNEGTILPTLIVRGVTGTVVQGDLRLNSDDPLEFDNVLYFTVEIQPPQHVLVVSDVLQDGKFWATALAPDILEKQGRAKYRCTQIRSNRLGDTDLSPYSSVSLINVTALPERVWKKLADYVESGGGVAVCLGSEVSAASYSLPAAASFLPAELLGHRRFEPPEFIDLTNSLDHPLLKKFAEWGAAALTNREIRRVWSVKPLPTASVLAWYTSQDKRPAILERVTGKGRTVMLTTGVSLPPTDSPSREWNDLPRSWAMLAFADQTMRYLSRVSQGPFNYVCGEDAIVRLDPEQPIRNYLLRKPNSQQLPGELAPGKSSLVIRTVDQLGHFRFLDATQGSNFERGFSVNPQPRESILSPISRQELDEILGKDRYSMGKTFEQLEKKGLGGQKIGLEVFSFLIFMLWLVFVGEHLVANRFYDAEPTAA